MIDWLVARRSVDSQPSLPVNRFLLVLLHAEINETRFLFRVTWVKTHRCYERTGPYAIAITELRTLEEPSDFFLLLLQHASQNTAVSSLE